MRPGATPLLARVSPRIWHDLEEHLESRDVAHVIYGSIVGLALVVALEKHPPSAGGMAGILIGTAVAIGLAELYGEVVADELRTRQPVDGRQIRARAREGAAVVFGASFPALFFLLAAVGVMGVDLAFTLSEWSGLALVSGYGFLAGRLIGAGFGRALLHGALVGLVAGALIALKSVLH